MEKYIYSEIDKKLRCRCTLLKNGDVRINMQAKHWYGWINYSEVVDLTEESKVEGDRLRGGNPMVLDYQYGGEHEYWNFGTLDIKKRAIELIKDYEHRISHNSIVKQRMRTKFDSIQ